MVQLKSRRSLDLDEHLSFHRHEWRASRVLWVLLLLTMLATGLGLFGNGLLSRTRREASQDGLSVEYDRFGRYGASMRLLVDVPAPPDGRVAIEISRSLIDAFLVQHITPAPSATELTAGGAIYRFDAAPGARMPIAIEVQPRQRWRVEGSVTAGRERVVLRQFIYP